MTKRETLIKTIGDRLIAGLYELDDNFDYEPDCEFGGYEASCRTQSDIKFGNGSCEAECAVYWPYNKSAYIEVILYGSEGIHKRSKNIDRINDAVEEYVKEHLDTNELFDAIIDTIRESEMDEWELHGFRNEADYYHWRYS